jgi:hypothetical protein
MRYMTGTRLKLLEKGKLEKRRKKAKGLQVFSTLLRKRGSSIS